MHAADLGLVAVVVRRAEEFAGYAAAGDGLEIPFRRIGFDGGFRNETVFPRRFQQVAQGFFLGEENRFIDLAAEEGFVFFGDLENRAATGALGEDDFRDVEERIDAGDLVDLLANELDGGFFRDDGDVDSFGRRNEFLAAGFRGAATSFLEIAAVSSVALSTVIAAVSSFALSTVIAAVSSFAAVTPVAAATCVAPVIAAALRVVALGGFVGVFLGGWLRLRARPRGAEGEFSQKAIEWVGRIFAHVRRRLWC